jgi:hypothetical protein
VGRNFIEKRELNAVASDFFYAAEPDVLAIAQLVELARLRAEDATEVMRGFAFHHCGVGCELIYEEAAAHARDSISTRHRARAGEKPQVQKCGPFENSG